MIDINFLKSRGALTLLEEYSGKNPYLKKMKSDYLKNKKISLTENQINYITNFHSTEPQLINKVVRISEYLGVEMQKQENISFIPEKILIEFMLADSEKTYHVYGKLTKNQEKSKMYWLPKTMVLDDPYFIDYQIDVDFDKYIQMDEKKRTPYKHQEEGIKFLLARNGCVLADDMGLGKMLSSDTPVLTPNGWVKHGTLKVGDYVVGSDGNPTKVLKVNPTIKKDFYKITFSDGTIVESCDEHLWSVQTANHKKRNNGFVTKPLKEFIGDLTYGTKGNLKWYIPMVKPIEFNKRPIDLDPYLLGCLLGDGGITQRTTLSSIDIDLINECRNRLPDGHYIEQIKNTCDYSLTGPFDNENLITLSLKKYKLLGCKSDTKFIPENYKFNSKKIRLEILQGLLDTDGYCGKNGIIQFYSTSEQLSNDVKELIQSFGGVARQSSKIGKYKKPDGTIVECKLCYILTINLPESIIPFKLKRKIDRISTTRKYLPSRGIKSIEYSRTTEGQCISVEADDHLYVMDKYVVTHNTYMAIVAALESGAQKILIVCPSSVKINWQREINNFTKEASIVNSNKWQYNKFVIINYDILKNFHTLGDEKKLKEEDSSIVFKRDIVNGNFDLVIIDEAHNLKNNKSIRGEIMVDICVKYNVPKVWLLSGTPIANRPMDYFNLLKIIKAPIADNWKFFAQRYCEGRQITQHSKYGKPKKVWLTTGASNLEELSIKTKNLILMRKKTDVLDMPDKTITTVYHELDKNGWTEYNNLWEEYLLERKKLKKRGSVDREMVELILLRKFIAMEGIPKTIELANNAIEQGHKVIIFTTFTDELNELAEKFGKECVVHNGPMSDKHKQLSIDKFQDDPKVKVFIGNIKSAGVGITLTAGDIVIFNSFDWVTGNNEQAEDRAYRIGQTNNVSVYYQLFQDTVSVRMWNTLKNKQDVINTIMNTNYNQYDEAAIILDYIVDENIG